MNSSATTRSRGNAATAPLELLLEGGDEGRDQLGGHQPAVQGVEDQRLEWSPPDVSGGFRRCPAAAPSSSPDSRAPRPPRAGTAIVVGDSGRGGGAEHGGTHRKGSYGLGDAFAIAPSDLLVVDLLSHDAVHWLRLEGIVEELYDIAVLPDTRRPMALGLEIDEIRRTISIGPPAAS